MTYNIINHLLWAIEQRIGAVERGHMSVADLQPYHWYARPTPTHNYVSYSVQCLRYTPKSYKSDNVELFFEPDENVHEVMYKIVEAESQHGTTICGVLSNKDGTINKLHLDLSDY